MSCSCNSNGDVSESSTGPGGGGKGKGRVELGRVPKGEGSWGDLGGSLIV